ncbi:hypothetical protein C0Q70_00538 [Pomacea canaliculata]|uniref:inorganic diphosphatase n=1 Tax=Pomacea canaliculata TaxID=400727 RepID=A0A2T7PWY2_POMCA|nr:hypothetical protein C0Q70_00538 [Pomacea canaliculata]
MPEVLTFDSVQSLVTNNHSLIFQINKEEKLNPIKQDVKSGRLRYVKNIFPHHGYIWNYGALPQTWENPKEKFPETGTAGDNDPLDVCEIGHKIQERGSVIQVKVLGTLLLIDEGETDWKIIAIDVSDPLASKLNGENLQLSATYEWFRYYKKPDGKPENTVHWNGECKGRDFALEIVEDANKQWHRLVSNSREASGGSISCANTTLSGSSDTIREEEAETTVNQKPALGPAAPVDQEAKEIIENVLSASIRENDSSIPNPPKTSGGTGFPAMVSSSLVGEQVL